MTKLVLVLVALAIMPLPFCAGAEMDDDESFLLKLPAPHSKEANEQEAKEEAKEKAEEKALEAKEEAKEAAREKAIEEANDALEAKEEAKENTKGFTKPDASEYWKARARAVEAKEKEEPKGLSLQEARQYLVSLINKDRATQKLKPVVLDEVASNAAQSHTDEMVTKGYLAHWGTDGRKPDQRYSEGGGSDAVAENAIADKDETVMPLLPNGTYRVSDLDYIEHAFFDEKPPMDGHRKNILKPEHNRVGIALSLAGTPGETRYACTEEFVDHYGEYGPIPSSLKLGQTFRVEGKLTKGVHLYCIELYREDLPKPMTLKELNATYSYSTPNESVASFWPGHFKTDAPVTLETKDGSEVFSVDIHLSTSFKKGLYYVYVWAKSDEANDDFPVLSKTIVVN